jgi:glycosidase
MITWLLLLGCKSGTVDTGTAVVAPDGCPTTFNWTAPEGSEADAVSWVGDANGWDSKTNPMTKVEHGWEISLVLEPGPHPYRFSTWTAWTIGGHESQVPDPLAALIQCETGQAISDCASMIVVPDCDLPSVSLVAIEQTEDQVQLELSYQPARSQAARGVVSATWDGLAIEPTGDGLAFTLPLDQAGHHSFRLALHDAEGAEAKPIYLPVWNDDAAGRGLQDGSLYFAMIDRVANGDPTNDDPIGTTDAFLDFQGGDFAGLTEWLPYLVDLGVRTLWISNPLASPDSPSGGDCAQTVAGFHGYWPVSSRRIDPHLGTDAELIALVDAAHSQGIRVIADWVGNHVHEDHPHVVDHPGWFHEAQMCADTAHGQLNFDRIPETCWFAPYLPDLDHSQPVVLQTLVDEAVDLVTTYGFDGLRVDAAKHMPHSVTWNLRAELERRVLRSDLRGETDFLLIGETWSDRDTIAAYVGPNQLHGQFDFPLYYATRDALGWESTDLSALQGAVAESAGAFAGARMGTFLGNHDVPRFVTEVTEGWKEACDRHSLIHATQPEDGDVLALMELAWTFLLTQPGLPLVYYGDEIGMPGHADPDNRQPLSWHVDPTGVASVSDLAQQLEDGPRSVLETVASLSTARAAHPAMWRGETTEWWMSPIHAPTLWAYGRADHASDDAVLVVLNRGRQTEELDNALAWAGLPTDGSWTDLLGSGTIVAQGDRLSFSIPPRSAQVWVSGAR